MKDIISIAALMVLMFILGASATYSEFVTNIKTLHIIYGDKSFVQSSSLYFYCTDGTNCYIEEKHVKDILQSTGSTQ